MSLSFGRLEPVVVLFVVDAEGDMYLWAGLHSEHGVDIAQRKSLSVNCADGHGPVIRGVPGDYDDEEDNVF